MKSLENNFIYSELEKCISEIQHKDKLDLDAQKTLKEMLWLAKSHYEIIFSKDTDISERVIFPISGAESNGIEDARFVKFTDDNGEITYYATYTAYDGYTTLPNLLETKDFYHFIAKPLHGEYVRDKNFALFPRKINGLYYMVSRVDGFNHYIMSSDNINLWEEGNLLLEPEYYWELVQVGNSGSPIETNAGWLMIVHGVGPMRKYCMSALLLDLNNPSKVIARLKEPFIVPNNEEREGYVPNVVYSCGSIINNNDLIIPYAISDYASTFAFIKLEELLKNMESTQA